MPILLMALFGGIILFIFSMVYPVEKLVAIYTGREPYKGRKHWFRFAVIFFLLTAAALGLIIFFLVYANIGKGLKNPDNLISLIGIAIALTIIFTLIATVIYYSLGKGIYAFVRASRFALIAIVLLAASLFIVEHYIIDKNSQTDLLKVKTQETHKKHSQPLKRAEEK